MCNLCGTKEEKNEQLAVMRSQASELRKLANKIDTLTDHYQNGGVPHHNAEFIEKLDINIHMRDLLLLASDWV